MAQGYETNLDPLPIGTDFAYAFHVKNEALDTSINKAAYASARLMPGDGKAGGVRYVLGASGHIAGSINPPSKNKRSYWTGGDDTLPANSEAWLHDAVEHPGSWWTNWSKWLSEFGGPMKPAPKQYGNAKYKVIEPAPGRYVKEKA